LRPRSWSQTEFCSRGLGTFGLGHAGSVSAVFETDQSFVSMLRDSCQKAIKPDLIVSFRKLFRRVLCCQTFSIAELILAADKKLFRQMSNTEHCLHPLLHNHRNSKISKSLKNCIHNYNYTLSHIETNLFKNCF